MSRFYHPLLLSVLLLLVASMSLVSCRQAKQAYTDQQLSGDIRKAKNAYADNQLMDDSSIEDVAVIDKKGPETDASRMAWSEILDKFGLDIPDRVVDFLDHANEMFEEHTHDREFNASNSVVAALKAAFGRTLEPVKKASDRPQGALDPVTVNELFDVMQVNFEDIMNNSSHVKASRVKGFVDKYVNDFFKSLKDLYRSGYAVGLSVNWSMIFIVLPFLDRIPTDIFFRDSFEELLLVPGQLKQSVHDFLEDLLQGDQAHFIRMIMSFAKTVDWQGMFRGEKVEL